MEHDRLITISTAGSRTATFWRSETLMWGDFVKKLATPSRGSETFGDYTALPKSKQDELKDCGGFVGGALQNGRRKPQYLIGRDVIALDLDNIPAGGTQDVLARFEALGVGYVTYSTRKHCEAAPRLRLLCCLDRSVDGEQYEAISLKLAEIMGMQYCDPSTFECTRLMYWPSCCSDGAFVFQSKDAPMLGADMTLALYADWRDRTQWPQRPGNPTNYAKAAAKQGDPLTKPGVVGAFNRTYTITEAMDRFIPGVYEPCGLLEGDRFTFTGGSTAGGAVLYDDDKFLYSHHATDPCGGRLVNAYDMVRLHHFGAEDDAAAPLTPVNRLPSSLSMAKLAAANEAVARLMRQERYSEATEMFSAVPIEAGAVADPSAWAAQLKCNPITGKPDSTYNNVLLMLEGDSVLADRMRYNEFADCPSGLAPLPWSPRTNQKGYFVWTDDDDAGLYLYIERLLGIKSPDTVSTALRLCMRTHAFNPVTEYLDALVWDGAPRLDSYFIDFIGAEDCNFVRTVTRKILVAAVKRAYQPGSKFDEMLVLKGPQGGYKSTAVGYLGGAWYSDSVISFEGKDGAELVQGCWIIEVPEMHALRKSDMNVVKSFLSRRDDKYREAYGKRVTPHPRRCVIFGTTNDDEYLHDPTGNRRFWPIVCELNRATKSIVDELDEDYINQVWAEAAAWYALGEPTFLSKELAQEAEQRREAHLIRDPMQGQIEMFLNKPIPVGWYDMTLDQHLAYWGGTLKGVGTCVPRDRVCAAEIIKECFRDTRATVDLRDATRVNAILDRIGGWKRVGASRFGDFYGRQRGFRRE